MNGEKTSKIAEKMRPKRRGTHFAYAHDSQITRPAFLSSKHLNAFFRGGRSTIITSARVREEHRFSCSTPTKTGTGRQRVLHRLALVQKEGWGVRSVLYRPSDEIPCLPFVRNPRNKEVSACVATGVEARSPTIFVVDKKTEGGKRRRSYGEAVPRSDMPYRSVGGNLLRSPRRDRPPSHQRD